jgi:M6 family metalloprotease-like protein
MMMNFYRSVLIVVSLFISVISALPSGSETPYRGPTGRHAYLRKSVSNKGYVQTARDFNWSINFHRPTNDTINIIAMRVEFKRDTLTSTTGNGLYGINRFGGDKLGNDKKEYERYYDDSTYLFDRLPHDSLYFAQQLESVAGYYKKVSRGRLVLTNKIYPTGKYTAYAVDSTMLYYSPAGKKKKESYDEYGYRKTRGYLLFLKDAITACANSKENPFAGIQFQESDSTFRDSLGRKTVFLIFHAGASGLTDIGEDGFSDSPSDIIDYFVTTDWFKDYADTLGIKQNGIIVQGKNSKLLIDEVMVCSETSNQNKWNSGIQGILVNQIARQIGILDLYSTTSGVSGVGAFCIMDASGYSAGRGFITPYPSAWVRAFMGWDSPKILPVGTNISAKVKALTSVLDNPQASTDDTTILMIPINDHEYYLIENRQRNLSGTHNFFNYDTTDDNDKVPVIRTYPDNVNLKKVLTSVTDSSKVVKSVSNNDISLPASGILVWHIDEKVIREKIRYNMINADSSYRGVKLIEADGADDIGVTFKDIYNRDAFDYGTGEDLFPHHSKTGSGAEHAIDLVVDGMGPYTFPSTRTNDGGHSYLNLKFTRTSKLQIEKSAQYRGSNYLYIENYSDSVFNVSVSLDYRPQYWPKVMVPESYFEPVLCDLDKSIPGKELIVISKAGRLNIFNNAADPDSATYVFDSSRIQASDLLGKTEGNYTTYYYCDSLSGVNAMPSVINGNVMVPSTQSSIHVLSTVSHSERPVISSIALKNQPTTYVSAINDSLWAVGCSNGSVIFGKGSDTLSSVKLKSDSAVCAIAAMKESGSLAVIQNSGTLTVCNSDGGQSERPAMVKGLGPFTLVTADIDNDSTSEIVVCDIKHGLWLYNSDLSIAQNWSDEPVDWATYYTLSDENKAIENRAEFPDNPAPPAIADINGDGYLDIIVGGTNGMYAFNYKGVLLNGWPAFLDKGYWYQKGSVVSSPAIAIGKDKKPLTIFSTTSGEKLGWGVSKITRADRNAGKIWYLAENGQIDSSWGMTPSLVDTFLKYDSLITPYAFPGGYIDAVSAKGSSTKPARPVALIQENLQSAWPLSAGSSLQTSPMIDDMDLDGKLDLIVVSKNGWVNRWEISENFILDTVYWPMPGFDLGRSFAYGSYKPVEKFKQTEPIRFYNFPNPTDGADKTIFRYAFSGTATNVRLDIFSITGINVYSKKTMGAAPSELTGSYPDWNEHIVSLKKFGPGIYRCRMEATISGKKHVRYWKMAVVK